MSRMRLLQFGAWQKTDIQAHIAFTKNLDKSLRESGELVSAEGLADPKQAKVVRAGKDGAPVTDGMFPRPKSFSPATGSSMSRRPSKPMRSPRAHRRLHDLVALGSTFPIEVRQVMSGPPDEFV